MYRPGPDWQFPGPDYQAARPERYARPLSPGPGKYSTQKEQPLKNFAAIAMHMPLPMAAAGPGRHAGDSRGDYEAGRRHPPGMGRVWCWFQGTRARTFEFLGHVLERESGPQELELEWPWRSRGCALGLIYIGRAHAYRAGSFACSTRICIRDMHARLAGFPYA